MDNFKYVQGVDYKLSGSGITLSATSIVLQAFKQPNGTTNLTMTDFGAIGYGVLEPGTSREENFSFTGVTQNIDGTATLSGVTRGLKFVDPYDQDLNLRFSHAGGTVMRISNTAQFYNKFVNKDDDETITGIHTYTNPNVPRMDALPTYGAGTEKYLATKDYVDNVAIAGAPNMTETQKGIAQEATQAEVDARTAAGSTGAQLAVNPVKLRATQYSDYAADAGGTDDYAITVTPAITSYVTGQDFTFKANTSNTGACTLNVCGLGAKTIKKNFNSDLVTGDIVAGQIVKVIYDGTNFQMVSRDSNQYATQIEVQNGQLIYAADSGGTDDYAITLSPAPSAYVTGMSLNFKANTANTGTATLNVNGLGAKTIVKNFNQTLVNNDIKSGQIINVIYDGTNFQMQSQTGNIPARFKTGNYTRSAGDASGSVAITGIGFSPRLVVFFAHGYVATANTCGSQGSFDGSNQSCSHFYQQSTAGGGAGVDTSHVIVNQVSGDSQIAACTSLDSDGFTLSWTKSGSGLNSYVSYICYA